MGFARASLRRISPRCCLKVCFKPVQRRRCCLRPLRRSWGHAFYTCRRSAGTDGDRSVSSHLGTVAALGELVPLCHQTRSKNGASRWQQSTWLLPIHICLTVPKALIDIQLPGFGIQHKQQLIRHRRLRKPDVPRCQEQGGCNTLNKTIPICFPVRTNGFEL